MISNVQYMDCLESKSLVAARLSETRSSRETTDVSSISSGASSPAPSSPARCEDIARKASLSAASRSEAFIYSWKHLVFCLARFASGEAQRMSNITIFSPLRALLLLFFGVASSFLFIALLPLALFDTISYCIFNVLAIAERHNEYLGANRNTFERAKYENGRWANTPYRCAHPFSEVAFLLYVSILWMRSQTTRSLRAHLIDFRLYLTSHTPDFPISCNDQIFGFDNETGAFQLSMLFVIERIAFEDVRSAFEERWTSWEPKTRSLRGRRWGRPCWRVLDSKKFRIEDHIIRKRVNLSETSIAHTLSTLASEGMSAAKPQWRVWVLEDDSSDCKNQKDTAEPPRPLTYVCGKWSHLYADGSAMMSTIVNRLGDDKVSMKNLPVAYRRNVPWWQVNLYYSWHLVRAAWQGLLMLCLHASTADCADSNDQTLRTERPHKTTGRKMLSTPRVIEMDDMSKLRLLAEKYLHVRLTINDIFAHCAATAYINLQNADLLREHLLRCLGGPSPKGIRHEQDRSMRALPVQTLKMIVPMMCRTSIPTCMDNFTAMVATDISFAKAEEQLVESMLDTKRAMDSLKERQQREITFVLISFICKCLPLSFSRSIYHTLYSQCRLCATNVAAPPIESRFMGREVLELFFWPALPPMIRAGASIISLGNKLQLLSVVDESEIAFARKLACEMTGELGLKTDAALERRISDVLSELFVSFMLKHFQMLLTVLVSQKIDSMAVLHSA